MGVRLDHERDDCLREPIAQFAIAPLENGDKLRLAPRLGVPSFAVENWLRRAPQIA
jgi:hypothetical protein